MKRVLLLSALLGLAPVVHADITAEPWPAPARRTFPHRSPFTLTYGDYRITISEPRDPEVRQQGGTGGPMLTFTVRHLPSGRRTSFDDQSVGTRLLRPLYHGRPQLEIWGRGGGGYYSRCLTRFVSGEYRCVRIDEFIAWEEKATDRKRTATLPGSNDVLYFVETRIPPP